MPLPLMPLKSLYELYRFLDMFQKVERKIDHAVELMNKTAAAVQEANRRKGYGGGWLFLQSTFISAVYAIATLNEHGYKAGWKTNFAQALKSSWGKLKNQIEAYKTLSIGSFYITPIRLDIIDESGWDWPITTDTLISIQEYCIAAACRCCTDPDTIKAQYKTGVVNIALETNATVKRIENGMSALSTQSTKAHNEILKHFEKIEAGQKEILNVHKQAVAGVEPENIKSTIPNNIQKTVFELWRNYSEERKKERKRATVKNFIEDRSAELSKFDLTEADIERIIKNQSEYERRAARAN